MENWKLHHIGIVVKDVDKATEYYKSMGATVMGLEFYQSLGIPTTKPEIILDNKSFTDLVAYGKPTDPKLKLRIRFAQMGPVVFEFLQPVEGESITKEFLDSKGEGTQHIAFAVDNFDEEVAELTKEGLPIIFSGKRQPTGGGFAYFETRNVGNTIIELLQA